MLVSRKEIEKLIRERDRLERMARVEYNDARVLFEMGNIDFANELQLANQHFGASKQITRTLKSIGYDENNRLSEKDRKLVIAGIKQKLCGVGAIGVGVAFISSGVGVIPFVICSIIGSTLCITKENIIGF